ncbi:hypothetical protein [Paenibacillus lautus]|uniref:hypothetical protein n=1 Tax=Paenibacillus lautus TaxID=1401 RepID=UPI003D287ADB
MNIRDIPLGELKKAKTKIALYEAGISFTHDRMFKDVLLDDIIAFLSGKIAGAKPGRIPRR